jgi:hypothetical protein
MDDSIYISYNINLNTLNNKELKTKNYETKNAKYLIFSEDDSIETSKYNSIIACPETNKIMCFSPPKPIEMNTFMDKNPEITENILVNEIIEGTMVNLFYDHRIQSWELATKGAVGGNYWFYRNQYSLGNFKNKRQITFREMFLEVFGDNGNGDLKDLEFLNKLSKDYSYTFVLQHPLNHIIKITKSPVLYLVAVYHLLGDNIISIPPIIFEEWNCFLEVRNLIKFPYRIEEESYEEINEKYFSKDSSIDFIGVMFYNLITGERSSIENERYRIAKELRGNNSNLQYQYLCLRNSGKVNEFLKMFPNYKELFYEFYKQYNNYITSIHQSYVSYYVKKSGIQISKKFFPLVYKIHHEVFLKSLNEKEKLIIKRNIVYDFISKIEPKKMIFYLNYNDEMVK